MIVFRPIHALSSNSKYNSSVKRHKLPTSKLEKSVRASEKLGDAELIRRIIDGDGNAFSVLHDRYKTSLLSYTSKRTGNLDDAQTVAQETWFKVSQHIGKLREAEKFSSWLFRIAYQLSVDLHREHQKRIKSLSFSRFSDVDKALEDAAVIEHRIAEQQSDNNDLQTNLLTAIAGLPDSERLPLLLQMEGMSYKEIAQEINITEGAVNNRLARARAKVKVLKLSRLLFLSIGVSLLLVLSLPAVAAVNSPTLTVLDMEEMSQIAGGSVNCYEIGSTSGGKSGSCKPTGSSRIPAYDR